MKNMNLKRQTIIAIGLILFILVGCSNNGDKTMDSANLEFRVDSVLKLMTLEEKLGQLTLYTSDWDVTGPVMRDDYIDEIKSGRCGNIFNAHTVKYNRKLQKIAVEESRLGIPLLFGYDVVHGHKTIFPIPLGEACSWNLELMEKTARLAAEEAAASGLNWTFAPMVDIGRDPRWGRVSEGNGEDTYLGSKISEARVMGFQGDDLTAYNTLASCVKHFAAYGAPIAGRDYNSVDMSEISFRQDYLPPYKAGVDAGAVSVMASFNDLFGVPAHVNKFLLTRILREEWNFAGFVVADYTGVEQVVDHGVAKDRKHAGELAVNAGLDMDMQAAIYIDHLAASIEEGEVSIESVDDAVKRILKVKFQLGLFDDPYLYFDEEREKETLYSEEILEHALTSAKESIVLLKNDQNILPLSKPHKIAVIGPMADNQLDMMGSWHGAGDHNKVSTVLGGLKRKYPESIVRYELGCDYYSNDKSSFRKAIQLARQSDVVILAIGENQAHSGEAASKSDLNLTGLQEELANALIETGKPIVVLIMAERPLTFSALNDKASTILYAWHLGTRGGDAIAEVLSGDYNPSGKLVMSIPRNVGQVPVYYNYKSTGRPYEKDYKYTTKYLDVENDPLYAFGYGLSYTEFEYSDLVLSDTVITNDDVLEIKVIVHNRGNYDGVEIVQLYIQDLVGTVTRPIKELKGFDKVLIKKDETREISFNITNEDLGFINADMDYVTEPGDFKVLVGTNSNELMEAEFTLLK
jgi:beta-glucosidase